MKNKIYTRGVAMISWVFILAAIIVIGGGGYYLLLGSSKKDDLAKMNPELNNFVDQVPKSTSSGKLSLDVCDYLTPNLVAKYISTPAELAEKSSDYVSRERACFYKAKGNSSNVDNTLAILMAVMKDTTEEGINSMYQNNIKSDVFVDISKEMGFKAWHISTGSGKAENKASLYFTSTHTIMNVSVEEKGMTFAQNLENAKKLAKEIQPQIP
jgi:hypothetical protein